MKFGDRNLEHLFEAGFFARKIIDEEKAGAPAQRYSNVDRRCDYVENGLHDGDL